MVVDAEAPSEFGVGVANGEFLGELSVRDKMLPMLGVLRVNRKGPVTGPLADVTLPGSSDDCSSASRQLRHDSLCDSS